MASKKRGGLSKREYASQTKAKVTTKSNRATASKSVAPLVGAGPLLPGQVRVGGTVQGAGPLLPNQTRDNSYTGDSSQREKASKASKSKSTKSSSSSIFGVPTAQASTTSNAPVDYNKVSLQSTGKVKTGAGEVFNKASDWLRKSAPFGVGNLLQALNSAGMDLSSAIGADRVLEQPSGLAQFTEDTGRVLGASDQQGMADFTKIKNQDPTVDPNDYMQRRQNRTEREAAGNYAPFADSFVPTTRSSDNDGKDSNRDEGNDFDPSFMGNGEGDSNDPRYQDQGNDILADYLNTNPASTPLSDTPGGTVAPRSGRGAGLFATGKGVGNPAEQDPYMAEMRKALKGYGSQEKDVRKQFEDMIKALDPTYQEYERQGKEALDKNLWNNNTQLASVMNANNTGDSEQRAQLMAGQQRDNQGQRADLVRKLLLDKQEQVTGYKNKSVDAVNSIRDKQMSARERYAQLLKEAQGKASTGSARSGSSAGSSSGKLSHNDIFNWTQDAIKKGYTWQEIADNAKEQGIGTETDGYLDKLLRQNFRA